MECHYGCNREAKIQLKNGNWCCENSPNKCIELKRKNSESLKLAFKEGRKNCRQFDGKRGWNKGLTKENNNIMKNISIKKKGKSYHNGKCKDPEKEKERIKKLSKFRTEWLKVPENRKNLGRGKRSYLELSFEEWLKDNNISTYKTEFHFWNEENKKNYFVDFLFEDKKLIIELDGTQHKKTIEKDKIRDLFLNSIGYKVLRISYEDYKKGMYKEEIIRLIRE